MINGRPGDAIGAILRAIRLGVNDPASFYWYCGLSQSYYGLRNYDEAARIAALAAQKAPHYPMAHRNHAIALAQAGCLDEARAALQRFLALVPTYSAEAARSSAPYRHPQDLEHFLEGLRRAGWQG